MAAVFPENMDRLNPDDTKGSFAVVENYIRYMTERMEFAMRNTTRAVSGASLTSPQVVILLEGLANEISGLRSEINEMKGQITSIKNNVNSLNDRVTELEKE